METFERKLQVTETAEIVSKSKIYLENSTVADSTTSHQEIYKEFYNIAAAEGEF